MRHPVLATQEFWAGAVFVALGGAGVAVARHYDIGTTMRMGPGYFPILLGVALILLGAASCVRTWLAGHGTPIGSVQVRSALLVTLSAACFALLLETAGLAVAVFATAFLACLGGRNFRLGESLAIAAALVAFTSLLFVYGLGLTVSIWPPGW